MPKISQIYACKVAFMRTSQVTVHGVFKLHGQLQMFLITV